MSVQITMTIQAETCLHQYISRKQGRTDSLISWSACNLVFSAQADYHCNNGCRRVTKTSTPTAWQMPTGPRIWCEIDSLICLFSSLRRQTHECHDWRMLSSFTWLYFGSYAEKLACRSFFISWSAHDSAVRLIGQLYSSRMAIFSGNGREKTIIRPNHGFRIGTWADARQGQAMIKNIKS